MVIFPQKRKEEKMKKNEHIQSKIDHIKRYIEKGRVLGGPGYDGPVEARTIGPEGITHSIKVMARDYLSRGIVPGYMVFHSSVNEEGHEALPGAFRANIACYSADESYERRWLSKKKVFRLCERLRVDNEFNALVADENEANRLLRNRALDLAELLAEGTRIPVIYERSFQEKKTDE